MELEQLKSSLNSSPILVPPDWSKQFGFHVDSSQLAVGGTLTKLDDNKVDRVVAYFSNKSSDAEERYTTNDHELMGLVSFLKHFSCYLGVLPLKSSLTSRSSSTFSRNLPLTDVSQGGWNCSLSFDITKVNLNPGRIHVLGDVLPRSPHFMQ